MNSIDLLIHSHFNYLKTPDSDEDRNQYFFNYQSFSLLVAHEISERYISGEYDYMFMDEIRKSLKEDFIKWSGSILEPKQVTRVFKLAKKFIHVFGYHSAIWFRDLKKLNLNVFEIANSEALINVFTTAIQNVRIMGVEENKESFEDMFNPLVYTMRAYEDFEQAMLSPKRYPPYIIPSKIPVENTFRQFGQYFAHQLSLSPELREGPEHLFAYQSFSLLFAHESARRLKTRGEKLPNQVMGDYLKECSNWLGVNLKLATYIIGVVMKCLYIFGYTSAIWIRNLKYFNLQRLELVRTVNIGHLQSDVIFALRKLEQGSCLPFFKKKITL